MTRRIGGMDFDITVGTTLIHVESVSLDVTDNSAVTQTRGVPDGWVNGDKSAEGEMELSESEFKKLNEEARLAGSWDDMDVFDILFYAETVSDYSKIEAFGCKLKVTSALSFDPKGGEKAKKKVAFMVTSPDFIHLDGVRIIGIDSLRGIVG
ncbi:TPA: DUF2597 family protein [Enterobacter kobei]|nr:DUF2597 family protein [Enterobacter kobei]